ncbi:hypothetical protein L1D34_27590 [Vibrio mediterranei]|uniref:hypothetical protein n=1 Tax=Vibrio mediterranei TaxID=689 RepID=UPI001EFC790C|nr:hypothetical protein [Vibrio mediterranei]MCG9628578.1 hypothetical protein [Vibrio mediterranei]
MTTKSRNPTVGYIKCPTCDDIATVHRTGEGRLKETGEPPKNARNLGLHYYHCPQCGNAPMSKSTDEFVRTNMKDTLDAVHDALASTTSNGLTSTTDSTLIEDSEPLSTQASHTNTDKPLPTGESSPPSNELESTSDPLLTTESDTPLPTSTPPPPDSNRGALNLLFIALLVITVIVGVLWLKGQSKEVNQDEHPRAHP